MEATQRAGPPSPTELVRKARRFRWGVLATGLTCGTFLIAFALNRIPDLTNGSGRWGLVGIYAGAAFLYTAGICSWVVFTRLARKLETGRD